MALAFTPQITEVQSYLNSIRKYKVMTDEEERYVFDMYKSTGDKKYLDMIINANQRILFSEAKKYARRESEVLDYVNEGNIGLMQAAEKFDPSLGFRFITFAMYYVRRNMSSYTVTKSEVRKSNMGKYTSTVARIKRQFFQENERDATISEIVELLEKEGLDVKDIRDILDLSIRSVDDTIAEDLTYGQTPEFNEYASSEPDQESVSTYTDGEYNKYTVAKALSMLDDRSREIMEMSFGIGHDRAYTDSEIADKFGLSNMRISQLKRDSIKKMKEAVQRI